MADRKITDYEIDDHGVENSQYFQGAGTENFDDVATGAGNNAEEAFDDALEQLASNDWDVSEIEREEGEKIKKAEAGRQILYYLTLATSWTGDKQDVDSSIDSGIEYAVPPASPEQEFQKEISDEEATLTFWGSIDDGAQQILDFCDEENIPILDKVRKELDDMARGSGMDSDMYYYLSIRVSGEEEPEEAKKKARKVANLAEKLMREVGDRKATFSKKFHQLTYWTSHNTSTSVNCDSLERAKQIVKKSGVEQTLQSSDSTVEKLMK